MLRTLLNLFVFCAFTLVHIDVAKSEASSRSYVSANKSSKVAKYSKKSKVASKVRSKRPETIAKVSRINKRARLSSKNLDIKLKRTAKVKPVINKKTVVSISKPETENVITTPEVIQSEPMDSFQAVGPFKNFNNANFYEVKADGNKEVLTLDKELQIYSENLLSSNKVAWGAIVAIDPKTGAVLSLSGHSEMESNGQAVATRNTFPAASLFKIITAAAAVETSGYRGGTEVAYRGGTYTLGKQNYLPSSKADRNKMSLGLALGKSCNPVFARVALNNLSTDVIKRYAHNFGFSRQLAKDFSLKPSTLDLDSDSYSLARTAAGFGSAFISPVHASMIGGAIGNDGLMMRPYLVDHINDSNGKVLSKTKPEILSRSVSESTAAEVLDMMSVTISDGTARKHFKNASPLLKNIPIAGKTGTLSGKNPKGLYHWFVAVAPMNNPKVGIATLVIDNGRARINAVGLGKKYLERYFELDHSTEQAQDETLNKVSKSGPLS